MKLIFIKLFKPKLFFRYNRLKIKQSERLVKINEAIKLLDKYQDMDINILYPVVARTLGIKNNKAAQQFITGLVISKSNINKEALKLPLKSK